MDVVLKQSINWFQLGQQLFQSAVAVALFAICSLPAQAQTEVIDEPLAITIPIRNAATDKMSVRTLFYGSGEIVVVASLADIKLVPSPSRSVPFEEYKSDWFAYFKVVPKISDSDTQRFLKIARNSKENILDKARKNGGDMKTASIKGERCFASLANVVSKDCAYRIDPAPSIPVEAADRKEIDLFLQKLAKELKTVEKEDSYEFLKSRLLQEPPPVFSIEGQ